MGDKSSSEDRYRSWREIVSFESRLVEASMGAVSRRRVPASLWKGSGEDAELSERSGRGFSKVHCWSCADTATSTMVAARGEGREGQYGVGGRIGTQVVIMCNDGLPVQA